MVESEGKGFYGGSDVVAEALAASKKAEELRSAAISKLLAQREEIDHNLTALGYALTAAKNGKHPAAPAKAQSETATQTPKKNRFRNLTLAQVGAMLLVEHGALHGTKIEELAKEGGYKGGTENFQNYLPIALKRDGRFENIGGNTWRLKEGAK